MSDITSIPSWKAWAAARARDKSPVPRVAKTKLHQYINDEDDTLDGCTFRYITLFLESGVENERLPVACADFGYTLDELRDLRNLGVTGRILAHDVLSRKAIAIPASN